MKTGRPRWSRSSICWGAGLFLLAAAAGWWIVQSRPRLNVLLVTLDTTRADHIGCYGYAEAHTPTLDGLAKDGVIFEHAYATVPLTLPSHTSILTGLYPPENGIHVNGRGRLDPQLPNLAATLRNAGYRTGAFIASIVLHAKHGLDHGFEVYDDDMAGGVQQGHESHLMRDAKLVVDSALSWLDGHQHEPFLCWVHLFDPHAPYEGHPEVFRDRFQELPYDGDIAFADLHVGRLIRFLKERGLYEQTLIIVVGDHGEGLGEHQENEHGFMLYETTVHVPLIVSCPSVCRANQRVSTAVSQVDLLPTVLECLQLPVLSKVSGISLLGALQGLPLEPRTLYAETRAVYDAYGWAPLAGVVDATWKFVQTTRPELYNLQDDPHELTNLAEVQPDKLAEMHRVYLRLQEDMIEFAASDAQLTESERRKLESLGYVAGGKAPPAPDDARSLPDVKDMMVHYNAEIASRGLIAAGKFDEAIAKLQGIIDAAPAFIPARMMLGTALQEQGRLDDAVQVFQDAIDVDPTASGPHFELGKHYAARGDAAQAVEHYQAAIRLDPDDAATARFNLGSVLFTQGDFEQARAQYELGLKEFPDSTVGQFNFSVLLASRGEHGLAIEHARRAAELSPQNPQFHFQLGTLYAAQGSFRDAVLEFERTVQLAPGFPQAAEALIQAQQAMRRAR